MNKATATRTATTAQMIAAITPPLKEPFPVTVPFPKYRRKEFWLLSFLKYVLHVYSSSMTICILQGRRWSKSARLARDPGVHFCLRIWTKWTRRSKSRGVQIWNGLGRGGPNLLSHRLSRVRKADGSALSHCVMETGKVAHCQPYFAHFFGVGFESHSPHRMY